jgi:hypothetical protein
VSDAPPLALDVHRSQPGTWARYATAWAAGGGRLDVTVSLIERTAKLARWELSVPGPSGAPLVTELTVRVEPGRPLETVARQFRGGDAPAKVVPASPQATGPPFLTPPPDARILGSEWLTVPAGRFRARHVQAGGDAHGFELWVSPRALPTGVIRFEEWTRGGNGVRLVQRTWELQALGRGARRSFGHADEALAPGDVARALGLPQRRKAASAR